MRPVFIICLLSFVFAPLSSKAQIPTYVPTSGLVGWWPFSGNANDQSSNANNGTVNGATLTTDRFGLANKAYSFDGINDYIRVSNSTSLNNSTVSISGWLNTNNLPTDDYLTAKGIVGKWWQSPTVCNSNYNAYLLCLTKPSGLQNTYLGAATNFYEGNIFYTSTPITTNNWYHFVFIHNAAGGGALYINGNLINSNSISGTICNSINDLIFGADVNNGNLYRYFNGKLDDIGIWNRSLSQQEITTLFNASAPPSITTSALPTIVNCGESTVLTASSTIPVQSCFSSDLPSTLQSGLVSYWPFCASTLDGSSNGNNGTLNGSVYSSDRFGNQNSSLELTDGLQIMCTNNLFNNPNQFSISLWFNSSNTTVTSIEGLGRIFGFDNGQCQHIFNQDRYIDMMSNGQVRFHINHTSGNYFVYSNPGKNNGNWHHVVCTFGADGMKLYIDGILEGSNSNTSISSYNGYWRIGGLNDSYSPSFIGKIDDVALFNRVILPSEIQQLYNLGNINYSWSTGATTPSITVTPVQTTSYTCTATNASGSTTSSVSVTVADTLTWTGALDTDWHKPCNWSPQFVPKCCNNVSVPLTSNQPIVSGVAAAEDLTIYTTNGAQVTINNGANLQVADCPTTITSTACPSLAVITTSAVTSVTQSTAVSGGTISYQGASSITARGVCWSTSPNPTIANSITSNGTGIGTFTSNLTGLVAGTTYYVRAYATNGSGTSYGNEVSFVAVNPQPAYPANSVFCASGPTLVIDVTNPTTGKTWMDRNLGATQVATSSTDAAAYGDLYQWGRGNDGHQCRTSATTTTLSATDQPGNALFIISPTTPNDWRTVQNNLLWQGVSGINNPCPTGYRLPTETELNNERLGWSANTSAGAFNSPLKITLAGYNSAGTILSEGVFGNYWTSTVSGTSIRNLNFLSSNAGMSVAYRSYGMTVRCIKQ